MLKESLDAVVKLFADLTLRRMLGVVTLLIIIAAGTLIFERLTSTLRLRKLERVAQLSNRLWQLDSAGISADSLLGSIQLQLKQELHSLTLQATSDESWPKVTPHSYAVALKRFFSGAGVWFLLAVGMANTSLRLRRMEQLRSEGRPVPHRYRNLTGTADESNTLANAAGALAVLFGLGSVFLPLPNEWWYLGLLHPFAIFIVGMGFIGLFELASKKPTAGRRDVKENDVSD